MSLLSGSLQRQALTEAPSVLWATESEGRHQPLCTWIMAVSIKFAYGGQSGSFCYSSKQGFLCFSPPVSTEYVFLENPDPPEHLRHTGKLCSPVWCSPGPVSPFSHRLSANTHCPYQPLNTKLVLQVLVSGSSIWTDYRLNCSFLQK